MFVKFSPSQLQGLANSFFFKKKIKTLWLLSNNLEKTNLC